MRKQLSIAELEHGRYTTSLLARQLRHQPVKGVGSSLWRRLYDLAAAKRYPCNNNRHLTVGAISQIEGAITSGALKLGRIQLVGLAALVWETYQYAPTPKQAALKQAAQRFDALADAA